MLCSRVLSALGCEDATARGRFSWYQQQGSCNGKLGDTGMHNVLIGGAAGQGIETAAQSLRRCQTLRVTASSLNETSCHTLASTSSRGTPGIAGNAYELDVSYDPHDREAGLDGCGQSAKTGYPLGILYESECATVRRRQQDTRGRRTTLERKIDPVCLDQLMALYV